MDKTSETTLQFVPVTEDSAEYLLDHVVLGLVCTYRGDTRRYTLMPVQPVRNKRNSNCGATSFERFYDALKMAEHIRKTENISITDLHVE